MRKGCGWVLLLAGFVISGCSTTGPSSVTSDRIGYSREVANSWKDQLLLNIVKMRYLDPPVFVDVASIVSGYTMETSAGLNTAASLGPQSSTIITPSAGVTFTDRPTITYAPQTGQRAVRGLLLPVPPSALMTLIQSHWPADLVLSLGANSINGLRNNISWGAEARAGDENFYRTVLLIREIQKGGGFGLRLGKHSDNPDDQEALMLFFMEPSVTPDIREKITQLKELLNLQNANGEGGFKLIYSPVQPSPNEFALETRSILNIIIDLASHVDVPQADLDANRAFKSTIDANSEPGKKLINIKSSETEPQNAFVKVRYRDHWFYLDDSDLYSKRTFLFLIYVITFCDSSNDDKVPILTIPTG